MELRNGQSDTLVSDMAQSAATGTLTGGNFGTPTTPIYLTFDYDIAAKYEVKLCTVAGSALTACSHVSGADVAHSAGAKVGRMLNAEVIDNLQNRSNGWIDPEATWAYASATTITVPAGAASIYSVGDKIRFQNNNSGTYLYAYVITVADTLLTVVGDAVPNATLTDNYYSKVESPVGFPQWFTFLPARAVAGGGTAPSYGENDISRFCIKGRTVSVNINWTNASGGTAGAGAGVYSFSLPVAAVNVGTTRLGYVGQGWSYEAAGTIVHIFNLLLSTTTVGFVNNGASITGADQSAANRMCYTNLTYEI